MLEELLAKYCVPALAGIKPANIVTCRKENAQFVYKEATALNKQLNPNDIYIEILRESVKHVLIIVYRKNVLERHINDCVNKAFLSIHGYGDAETLEEYLSILKARLAYTDFPHEIGVFLGYPLRDIYSFINHRDEGCLFTGEWKVYHDPEAAKKLFLRFNACKKAVMKKVADGKSLAQIFCVA